MISAWNADSKVGVKRRMRYKQTVSLKKFLLPIFLQYREHSPILISSKPSRFSNPAISPFLISFVFHLLNRLQILVPKISIVPINISKAFLLLVANAEA